MLSPSFILSFLQHDCDELTKKLASITEHVRKKFSMRKTQCTMDAFLKMGFILILINRVLCNERVKRATHLVRYTEERL